MLFFPLIGLFLILSWQVSLILFVLYTAFFVYMKLYKLNLIYQNQKYSIINVVFFIISISIISSLCLLFKFSINHNLLIFIICISIILYLITNKIIMAIKEKSKFNDVTILIGQKHEILSMRQYFLNEKQIILALDENLKFLNFNVHNYLSLQDIIEKNNAHKLVMFNSNYLPKIVNNLSSESFLKTNIYKFPFNELKSTDLSDNYTQKFDMVDTEMIVGLNLLILCDEESIIKEVIEFAKANKQKRIVIFSRNVKIIEEYEDISYLWSVEKFFTIVGELKNFVFFDFIQLTWENLAFYNSFLKIICKILYENYHFVWISLTKKGLIKDDLLLNLYKESVLIALKKDFPKINILSIRMNLLSECLSIADMRKNSTIVEKDLSIIDAKNLVNLYWKAVILLVENGNIDILEIKPDMYLKTEKLLLFMQKILKSDQRYNYQEIKILENKYEIEKNLYSIESKYLLHYNILNDLLSARNKTMIYLEESICDKLI